jgi:hypothetical protein
MFQAWMFRQGTALATLISYCCNPEGGWELQNEGVGGLIEFISE